MLSMRSSYQSRGCSSLVIVLVLVAVFAVSQWATCVESAITLPKTGLVRHFYRINDTCGDVEEYIKHQVKLFWDKDHSITPKLLRLLYSDCFVSGCDASVLLDGPNSERHAPQNRGLGGFVLIDKIKEVLEKRCPGVVSCADILNLATRDAVHLAGAPSYPIPTGRRDGMSSNKADVDLPSPSISWEESLAYFKSKGLDILDMTTLLGAHTMGSTHCYYVLDRLYNYKGTKKPDPDMDPTLLADLRKKCPPKTTKGQHDPLVYLTPENAANYRFTNTYYSRLLKHQAVLEVDQQLYNGDDTKVISEEFAAGFEDFRKSWALSMSRMGSLGVLTGKQGQIRRHCSSTN